MTEPMITLCQLHSTPDATLDCVMAPLGADEPKIQARVALEREFDDGDGVCCRTQLTASADRSTDRPIVAPPNLIRKVAALTDPSTRWPDAFPKAPSRSGLFPLVKWIASLGAERQPLGVLLRKVVQAMDRGEEVLSHGDLAVLARAELASERVAAFVHAGVVLAIVCAALVASITSRSVNPIVVGVMMANLGTSALGIAFARRRRLGAWLPWTAGMLDVVVLVGIVVKVSRFQSSLPGAYKPALIAAWGAFLALALSAMRGRPGLLLVQSLLFAGGLAFAVTRSTSGLFPAPGVSDALAVVFGPGENAIRIGIVPMVGAVMAMTALRARITLRNAVVASRRAANLSRYLAPAVASVVANTDVTALREGRHQNVAILFADLRDFSSLAETMTPRETAAFLTTFRRHTAEAIEREGGIIDKFIGDEVMGLFGVPTPTSRDAGRAIRAAQTLLASVRAWSVERTALGLSAVEVGVGIHYGPVFAGVLGDDRLEFTVLGNTVNVARRLEELTKSFQSNCIVSAWAIRAARAEYSGGWSCRGLPAQSIRGQSAPVAIFALSVDESGSS